MRQQAEATPVKKQCTQQCEAKPGRKKKREKERRARSNITLIILHAMITCRQSIQIYPLRTVPGDGARVPRTMGREQEEREASLSQERC